MEKTPVVSIMASGRNGTLYTGVTSHLIGRIHQHRDKTFDGFTAKHDVNRLVWLEVHAEMEPAIVREADQGMATRVEACADREGQSDVARSGGGFRLRSAGWLIVAGGGRDAEPTETYFGALGPGLRRGDG
jgi:predicted GIY-YIG superfamily endonuclease